MGLIIFVPRCPDHKQRYALKDAYTLIPHLAISHAGILTSQQVTVEEALSAFGGRALDVEDPKITGVLTVVAPQQMTTLGALVDFRTFAFALPA